MKRSLRSLVITALGLSFLTASAWAQSVILFPRVFVGTIYQGGDSNNWGGSLTASNPTCTLTVPANNEPVMQGVGPKWKLVAVRLEQMPGQV